MQLICIGNDGGKRPFVAHSAGWNSNDETPLMESTKFAHMAQTSPPPVS